MEDFEDIELITPDNVKLKAYWIKGRSAAALGGKDSINDSIRNRLRTERDDGLSDTTVLYLHANAGNMGHRLPIASALQRSIPSTPHIFMLSYRGYGHSEGSPSEKGLMVDAQTALDYILNHATLGKTKILLYGQSIGGAVAISLAFANQENQSVAGLIIENTFLSIVCSVAHFAQSSRSAHTQTQTQSCTFTNHSILAETHSIRPPRLDSLYFSLPPDLAVGGVHHPPPHPSNLVSGRVQRRACAARTHGSASGSRGPSP